MHLFSDIYIEAYKKLLSTPQNETNTLVDPIKEGSRISLGQQWSGCAQNFSCHPPPITQDEILKLKKKKKKDTPPAEG